MTKANAKRSSDWTEFVSSKGATYLIPPEYSDAASVSEVIRRMAGDGWSRYRTATQTGIRYQHVRNVLETPLKRS